MCLFYVAHGASVRVSPCFFSRATIETFGRLRRHALHRLIPAMAYSPSTRKGPKKGAFSKENKKQRVASAFYLRARRDRLSSGGAVPMRSLACCSRHQSHLSRIGGTWSRALCIRERGCRRVLTAAILLFLLSCAYRTQSVPVCLAVARGWRSPFFFSTACCRLFIGGVVASRQKKRETGRADLVDERKIKKKVVLAQKTILIFLLGEKAPTERLKRKSANGE